MRQQQNNRASYASLYDNFVPIYNYDMSSTDQSGILISTLTASSMYECAYQCGLQTTCLLIQYKATTCNLYSAVKYSVASTSIVLYQKFTPDVSAINTALTHNWPFNANYADVVGTTNGTLGANTVTFVSDRFGNTQSAVSFSSGGYVTLPSAAYFNGVSFTIAFWVYVNTQVNGAFIFSFTSGNTDQVIGFLHSSSLGQPSLVTTNAGSSSTANPGFTLSTGVWQHLTITLNSATLNYYLNGASAYTGTTNAIRSFTASTNQISSKTAAAILDDMRMFSRDLTPSEVVKVLNSYY